MSAPESELDLSAPRERAAALLNAVLRLAGVLRIAMVHSTENQALATALGDLGARLATLVAALGPITITLHGDVLRVNGAVAADLSRPNTPTELHHLRADFARHGIGGVTVTGPPTSAELVSFVRCWQRHAGQGGEGVLGAALERMGVQRVGVSPPQPDGHSLDASGRVLGPREVLSAYAALLATAECAHARGTEMTEGLIERIQAVMEQAAALSDSRPELLLFAATFRDAANYAAVHAANTAVLSMLLARRVGLGHEAVSEIGQAALLVDVGMRDLPETARLSPGDLDAASTHALLDHPLRSVLFCLGVGALDPSQRARVAVAWEHHCGLDGEGYPRPAPGGVPHLFTRIVSICDAYDALLHDRGDRSGLARPLALEALHQEVDRRFDRQLMYALYTMLGRFPPGSVVRIQDGAVGVVCAPARDPRLFDRPELLIVRDRTGAPLPRAQRIVLWEQRGERASRIVDTLDDRLFEETLLHLLF